MIHARIDHALIRTPVAWPLRAMIAIIVFIAGLALLTAWTLSLSAVQLDRGLRGQLTVELAPDEDGAVAPRRVAELVQALQEIPGVTKAKPLDDAEVAALLRPWLGQEVLEAKNLALLPLPRLIDVQVDDVKRVAPVSAIIKKKFRDASLADHQAWLQRLAGQARQVALALLALVTVMLLALFSTVVFACRAGLNVQKPAVTLLHIIGATDDNICGQMRHYAWRLIWPGCLLGILACAGMSALLFRLVAALAPQHYASATEIFWIGAVALGFGLSLLTLGFARLSANIATRRVLMAMP